MYENILNCYHIKWESEDRVYILTMFKIYKSVLLSAVTRGRLMEQHSVNPPTANFYLRDGVISMASKGVQLFLM